MSMGDFIPPLFYSAGGAITGIAIASLEIMDTVSEVVPVGGDIAKLGTAGGVLAFMTYWLKRQQDQFVVDRKEEWARIDKLQEVFSEGFGDISNKLTELTTILRERK